MIKTTDKPFLYAYLNEKSFCDIHRLLYPLRYTSPDFPELDFDLSISDPTRKYSYYCTHGCPPLNNLVYVGEWQRAGGKWILSVDDDFETVPQWNNAKLSEQQLNIYRVALGCADVILSSTPTLTKAIGLEHKTITAPNMMNVSVYQTAKPAPKANGEKLRVLWAGSKTHVGDLALLEKPLDDLIPRFRDRVEFIFIGSAPPNALKKYLHNGLYYESGVPAGVYHELISKVRPHIVLAPLADIPFNHSKSRIRVLEGFCVASAVVASPVGEYTVIKEGVDGEYANSADEWVAKLERLFDDEEYRLQLATAGRKRVAEEFDWENKACRKPWQDAIKKLKAWL